MGKVKNFFVKTGVWFKNHAPTKRRIIQVYAALLFNCNIKGYISGRIYQGDTKNLCVPGLNCYSCPGAIGACPLGALQDSLSSSGKATPYYIIGILALFGLIFARTICGFLCPMGLGQELLYKIKTPKVKKHRVTRILSYFKYVLLAVLVIAIPLIYHGVPAFCKYICPAGTFEGGLGLLQNPNNDDFFGMLDYLFSWKFLLLIIFIVASIFIYRFFCRFFCPLGAILGFFNKWALIGVKLDDKKCVDCGMCIQTCKMDIKHVGDHECINCGECVPVCPTKAISWKGSKIFLHGIDQTPAAETEIEEKVSLTDMVARTEVTSDEIMSSEPEKQISAADSAVCEVVEEQSELSVKPKKRPLTKAEKVKKRNFILEVCAWALAAVLLISAIVYYNALIPASTTPVYKVGDRCPDFILRTYDTAGAYDEDGNRIEEYSSLELKNAGKVMVVNFWYTDCGPCKAEIPHFNEVQNEYGDKISIVIVHIVNRTTADEVQQAINGDMYPDFKAKDYNLIFAQDTKEDDLATKLGVKGACPVTTVIDTEGKISCIHQSSITKAELIEEVEKALGN